MSNFRTQVNFSSQIKEYPNTDGTLSGSVNVQQYTILGTDYLDLPLGLDNTSTGITATYGPIINGTFTGTTGSTTFYFNDSNMDIAGPYLSAITASNSGLTQHVDAFSITNTIIVDGNSFDIYYSGVSFDMTPTNLDEYSPGEFSGGTFTNVLNYLSGTTYPWWFLKSGSTTWNEVKGRTQTDRLTIIDGANTDYVLISSNSNGDAIWRPLDFVISGGCLSDVCIKGILSLIRDLYIKGLTFGTGGSDVGSTGTTYVTNTAGGKDVLFYNSTGIRNTGFGSEVLSANTIGYSNTGLGTYALKSNSTGIDNTAIGTYSLESNTINGGNTAIGSGSLQSNTIGYGNTGIGYNSIPSNIDGYVNTGLGIYALHDNVSGYENVSAGHYSLFQNTTGYQNTGIGNQSITSNTTGNINTGIGYGALGGNTIGLGNTSIGWGSGLSNTTGNYNTFLGLGSDCITTNLTNATAVGYNAIVDQNDSMVLGNGVINVGIGISTPTSTLHLIGLSGFSQLRLEIQYTPTGTTDSNGSQGDTAWDDSYIYIKTSVGWKRSGLSTF
jgi:hypothetical protein